MGSGTQWTNDTDMQKDSAGKKIVFFIFFSISVSQQFVKDFVVKTHILVIKYTILRFD
jgi:hypothetical protein